MIILGIFIGLLLLYIIRAILGPTIWDRVLAMNLASAKIILITVVVASTVYGAAYVIDLALIYALSGFMGTIFIALFVKDYRLGKKRQGRRRGEK